MRKCLKCTARLADDVEKCPACGSEELSEILPDDRKPAKRKIGIVQRIIITVVLLAVCLAAVGYLYFEKVVPSKPIEASVTAIYEGDMEAHLNAIPPDVRESERALLKQSYGSNEQFKANSQESLSESLGKNVSVKVQTVDTQKLSNEALIQLQESVKDYITSEIKSAAYVTVKITLNGDDGEIVTSKTITSLKINGKWYAQNTLFKVEN